MDIIDAIKQRKFLIPFLMFSFNAEDIIVERAEDGTQRISILCCDVLGGGNPPRKVTLKISKKIIRKLIEKENKQLREYYIIGDRIDLYKKAFEIFKKIEGQEKDLGISAQRAMDDEHIEYNSRSSKCRRARMMSEMNIIKDVVEITEIVLGFPNSSEIAGAIDAFMKTRDGTNRILTCYENAIDLLESYFPGDDPLFSGRRSGEW